MIAITAANGSVGRATVRELAGSGAAVRALVRRAERAGGAVEVGAEIVVADLDRPEGLAPALEGVHALVLVSPHDARQARREMAVVEHARRAGVSRVVKVSGPRAGVGPESPVEAGRAHWQVEQALERSGLEHVILRPAFYMQNLLRVADVVRRAAVLALPLGEARLAMVDVRDVAAVAAALATAPAPIEGDRVLTGPAAVGLDEVADRLAALAGVRIRYVPVSETLAAIALRLRGEPSSEIRHIRGMSRYFRAGGGGEVTGDVQATLGRAPRSIDAFLGDHCRAFGR